jgi:hypothetical protein
MPILEEIRTGSKYSFSGWNGGGGVIICHNSKILRDYGQKSVIAFDPVN